MDLSALWPPSCGTCRDRHFLSVAWGVRVGGEGFGVSDDAISALAGMVWGTHAGGVPPDKHVRGAGLDPTDRTLARVMKLAQELMGFPRHLSQHVGGFVLTRGPLVEVVPVGNAAMADRT